MLFFEHKFLYRRIKEELPDEDYTVPLGKAMVRRAGRDLTIVTYAAMVHTSLEAAEELASEGIEAEVVDLRTLLPLDRETILESVRRTNKLLVVHEDTRTGGIAGEIAALVTESAFEDLDGPDPARHFAGYAGAVFAAARGTFFAQRGARRGRGARTGALLNCADSRRH